MTRAQLFQIVGAVLAAAILSAGLSDAAEAARATLLFENLGKLVNSFPIDDSSAVSLASEDGPKGLATADIDGDGWQDLVAAKTNGTIAVLFGRGGADFEPAIFLATGDPRGLREVIAADITGDGRPEIIAAHPFEGTVYIYSASSNGNRRSFPPPRTISTWQGARSVVVGDFDGDGKADLVVGGAGEGVREYRGDGNGGFTPMPALPGIDAGPSSEYSARPVFTMQTWRRTGESSDRVAVSFAGAGKVWLLARGASGDGNLEITATVPLLTGENVYDLALAHVSAQSRASGEPDLLTAAPWSGEVFIRRYTGGLPPYPMVPQQRLAVPGAPRALAVADVNGDSWPDLLVAAREGHSLSLFLNTAGVLALGSQAPAGSSPRDVVSGDFDGDGSPDAAVINRYSHDITVHRIDPVTGWFYQSPLVNRMFGGATAASVGDLDGDGRGELLYLTPATGEANIRNLDGQGRWTAPSRYFMGVRPQSLGASDVNADGRLDLVSTSLGDGQTVGGLTYRLQLPDHTFGPLVNGSLGAGGAMFAEVSRDFDGDGLMDRVAVYTDCRIAFFQGTPQGLVHRRTEQFVYEARGITAVDLDGDGDLDLIGAGAYGDPAVVENNGQWFTNGPYRKIPLGGGRPLSGAYAVKVEDTNGDGYLDVTVFSRDSVARWNGGPGLAFEFDSITTLAPTLGSVSLDFDGDGIKDTFALCPANTTASFFKGIPGNPDFWTLPYKPYAVPAVSGLGAGDLDGDGLPDLVGVGEHLWVGLSGTPAPPPVPTAFLEPPLDRQAVVINEVLASTSDFIAAGADKPVDCVEIFNGTAAPVNLSGWKLRLAAVAGESQAADFIFPAGVLQPGGHAAVFCTGKTDTAWNAPFKLPESGGTLRLLNPGGADSDVVSYPPQQPDISYARLFDGSRDFVFSPFPSILSTNYDNGSAAPKVSFKGVDTALLSENKWRFRARAWSPNGMFTLIVHWREVTSSLTPQSGIVLLYDDGMHDDGGSLDGTFAGDWDRPLRPGTPIEFYITGMDLRWISSTQPEGPQFTTDGQSIENYTLAVPAIGSGWEISEVVPRNQILTDETGVKKPDWTELRYTGSSSSNVKDLFLADSLFSYNPTKLYDVSRLGSATFPGQTRVVYLDDTPFDAAKPAHAAFGVDGESGDSIYLLRRLPSGVTEFVDAAKVPPLPPNTSYARVGAGGPFVQTIPTPNGPNAPAGGAVHLVPARNGGSEVIFAFPGTRRVEASYDLQTWSVVLPSDTATTIERTYREPVLSAQRFFRLR